MFTYKELVSLVPKKQKTLITENLVEIINTVGVDDDIAEEFKQNFVTYSTIIGEGKYTVHEYKNAIQFITLLLLENKDIDAYEKVFPDRYQRLIDRGLDRSKISSYATNYKKTQLVTKIIEQTLTPAKILNAPMFQEALNHQRTLMMKSTSDMVQHLAAKTIMEYLAVTEDSVLKVDVSVTKNEVVEENESFMLELAEKKLELMRLGGDVKSIANMTVKKDNTIIDVEEA